MVNANIIDTTNSSLRRLISQINWFFDLVIKWHLSNLGFERIREWVILKWVAINLGLILLTEGLLSSY